jgi:hypothetical protein
VSEGMYWIANIAFAAMCATVIVGQINTLMRK